jgi:hypothetical protein
VAALDQRVVAGRRHQDLARQQPRLVLGLADLQGAVAGQQPRQQRRPLLGAVLDDQHGRGVLGRQPPEHLLERMQPPQRGTDDDDPAHARLR